MAHKRNRNAPLYVRDLGLYDNPNALNEGVGALCLDAEPSNIAGACRMYRRGAGSAAS